MHKRPRQDDAPPTSGSSKKPREAVLGSSSSSSSSSSFSSSSSSHVDILIVGAGPTGLGAAARLSQSGHSDWRLVEARDGPGGLAYTTTTPEGFMFDTGGHVIFSHYSFFDELIDAAVGGNGPEHWNSRQRVSHVLCRGVWVPYPFQKNLSFLPLEDQEKCLLGAIDASVKAAASSSTKPVNFDEWILRVMGEGIANIFMRPYNFKVWACPPSAMQCGWLGERVATVNAKELVSDVLHNRAADRWGPNASFRFPTRGGTGKIWKDVAAKCCGPQQHQQYDTKVVGVDTNKKEVTMEGKRGEQSVLTYNKLLTTMPLDQFLQLCDKEVKDATVDTWNTTTTKMNGGEAAASKDTTHDAAAATPSVGLVHSSSHIIGLGIRGTHEHGDKCWQYFPDDDCPFYRCTVFTNYSNDHAPEESVCLPTIIRGNGTVPADATPKTGPYFSLMLEVSESQEYKPVDAALIMLEGGLNVSKVVLDTIQGCVNTGMMKATDEVVSIHYERLEYGYPTPSLGRDSALDVALPLLKKKSIWSRGRFGAWKYEVANQDHSCMQGVEAVDNMLTGSLETTVNYPGIVNKRGGKNVDIHFVGGQ